MKTKISKKILVLIIAIGVLGLFLLSWLFNRSETEKNQNTQQETTDNSFTPSQQEIEADANSDDLSQSKNNSLQVFTRDFTTKYLNYNPSKPQAHIESLKGVMESNIYAQEMTKNKTPSVTKKSIKIQKIYITDIIVGDRYTSVTVLIDVTLTTTDDKKIEQTYEYRYDIVPDKNGWKVVWITDESQLGQ